MEWWCDRYDEEEPFLGRPRDNFDEVGCQPLD